MIVRDSVRVKTDGKGTIRIVIMRDGNVISGILNYSFSDGTVPLAVKTSEAETVVEEISEAETVSKEVKEKEEVSNGK